MNQNELTALTQRQEEGDVASALTAAAEAFGGRLTFATALDPEGGVIIAHAAELGIELDVFSLDTGLFFPETLALWKRIEERYGYPIRAARPELSVVEQADKHGAKLWVNQPNACCRMRKIEPLRRELAGFDAWITGIRREQTENRRNAKVFEWDETFCLAKVNPVVAWSHKEIWAYVMEHDVPYNPLHDQGYPSIGCQPCTARVRPGEDPRAGRWTGLEKTECGLHEDLVEPDSAGDGEASV